MKDRVVMRGWLLDEIPGDNGVKQEDIPATTLVSIFVSVMLTHVF